MINQILKSGTLIGANGRKAQNAESKADETKYWLDIAKHANSYPFEENLLEKISEIEKVLSKIISTSKRFSN